MEHSKENIDPNILHVQQMKSLFSTSLTKEMIRKLKTIKCNVVEQFIKSNKVDVDLIQDVLGLFSKPLHLPLKITK